MTGGIPHRKWYEITGAKIGDRRVKVHKVSCQQCSASHYVRPGRMDDVAIQHYFERKGWRIGRHQDQHLCPRHAVKPKVHQSVPPPKVKANLPPNTVVGSSSTLKRPVDIDEIMGQLKAMEARAKAAEQVANEQSELRSAANERVSLTNEQEEAYKRKLAEKDATITMLVREAAERSTHPFQHGTHIDSMPTHAELPSTPHPPLSNVPPPDVANFDHHGKLYEVAAAIILDAEGSSQADQLRRFGVELTSTNRSLLSKAVRILRTDPTLRNRSINVAWHIITRKRGKSPAPDKPAPRVTAGPRRHIDPIADLARLQAIVQMKK